MGREINFRLSEPTDEKVTANFAFPAKYGDIEINHIIVSDVKLEIKQTLGLVEKDSCQAVIHAALVQRAESSQSCDSTRKCPLRMQLVRQDPPGESDWDELVIYEHTEDDCPYCDMPTAEVSVLSQIIDSGR